MNANRKVGFVLGVIVLLIQVASIIYARFTPERFFCWGPYDQHSHMEVQVKIKNRILTHNEIKKRYRCRAIGWEKRSIDNIFRVIKQYELTYGVSDNASVLVKYSINGREEQIWYLQR